MAYIIVILRSVKHKTEFRQFCICVIELWPEQHHHPVFHEVVELLRVRALSLGLEADNLFVGDINLEAYDVSILDFTPGEGVLRLHELDRPRFGFLGKDEA